MFRAEGLRVQWPHTTNVQFGECLPSSTDDQHSSSTIDCLLGIPSCCCIAWTIGSANSCPVVWIPGFDVLRSERQHVVKKCYNRGGNEQHELDKSATHVLQEYAKSVRHICLVDIYCFWSTSFLESRLIFHSSRQFFPAMSANFSPESINFLPRVRKLSPIGFAVFF